MNRILVPEDIAQSTVDANAMRSLSRAIVCAGTASFNKNSLTPDDVARSRGWGSDRQAVRVLTRAASSSAGTMDPETQAIQTIAVAFLRSLVPLSAGAAVLAQAVQLSFNGASRISLPTLRMSSGAIGFVAERAPIPVAQMTSAAGPPFMTPTKFAVAISMTNEMLMSANAEELARIALLDQASAQLDAALFSNAAAVANLRPAGLFAGVTPLTASTSTGLDAMVADVSSLLSAIAPYSGNSNVALIGNVSQLTAIGLRSARPVENVTLYASAAMPPGTVAAVALQALVSASGPPVVEASRENMLIHMEDTTPLPIGTPGTPPVVAAPVRSLWQTDSAAIKLRQLLAWTLRAPAVALVTNTKW